MLQASAPPSIIVMEFNELCPPLLERWTAEGKLPNFARLAARSDVLVTDADVDSPTSSSPGSNGIRRTPGSPMTSTASFT